MPRTVILSGAIGSQSEAIAQSKDPAVAVSFAAVAGSSPDAQGRRENALMRLSEGLGSKRSFDCAGLRFANSRSAQDDNVLGTQYENFQDLRMTSTCGE